MFVPEISGNEAQYSVRRLVAFLFLFVSLEVFDEIDS